jgi:uncharacterized protein (TIGR03435 family)
MKSLMLIVFGIALSQGPGGARPSFEVASVKPSVPRGRESLSNQPGGRFVANNVTLRMMVGFAYGLRNYQIVGGPPWIADDQWNIEGRAGDGRNAPDATPLRLQSLLEDRFALKTHHETRELPVYALTVGKDGMLTTVDPPPQSVPSQTPPAPPVRPDGTLPTNFMPVPGRTVVGPGLILASAVTMAEVARVLTGQVGRPVLDKTNLTGYYNIRLQFAPETAPAALSAAPGAASEPSGSSIFTTIQEQLGLKLDSTKAPFDVMVIDSARKPVEN